MTNTPASPESFARLHSIEAKCVPLVQALESNASRLREVLNEYANGKLLKGREYVGWLGEVYGRALLGGELVKDGHAHDLLLVDNSRVSIKTRMGAARGWNKSSAIPRTSGNETPTHLLFISLNTDGSVRKAWYYKWSWIESENRLLEHKVRGAFRSLVFFADEASDSEHVIYPTGGAQSFSATNLIPPARPSAVPELPRPWGDDPYWTRAIDRAHEAGETCARVTFDLAALRDAMSSSNAVYQLMNAMHAVREREGEDGFKGAARLALAFIQLLADEQAAARHSE